MTVETLKDCNKKALAQMARDQGVIGWHAMRKDQLVKALSPDHAPNSAHSRNRSHSHGHANGNGNGNGNGRHHEGNHSLSHRNGSNGGSGGGTVKSAALDKTPNSSSGPTAAKSQTQPGLDHGQDRKPRSVAASLINDARIAAKGSDGSSALEPIVNADPKNGREDHRGREAGSLAMASAAARLRSQLDHTCDKDRIIAVVRDPYWLHVYWELSRSTMDRAKAAMKQDWHTAKPILRLLDITSEDTTCSTERQVRDIEIHGEVNNWYIDVATPPRSFRVDIGYLARNGTFYVLARSNIASTPKTRIVDMPGAETVRGRGLPKPSEYDRDRDNGNGNAMPKDLRDLYETRISQPVHNFSIPNLAPSSLIPSFGRDFDFQIDAELIVYGRTEPNAKVTLQGEPVKLRSDGTFSVRFGLPDSRQIIPAVASSPDGVEERTIVLAIERNTKTLEPQIHEANDL